MKILQLSSRSEFLLGELIVAYLIKKFAFVHGTRRFITVFTNPATGSYPELHESSPPTSAPLL